MCNFITEAVLQSTNSGDETAEKRQSIIGQPICERAQGQGQQRGGLKLGETKKKIPVIITCIKQSAKMNVNFLELILPTCTSTPCC